MGFCEFLRKNKTEAVKPLFCALFGIFGYADRLYPFERRAAL
jgi:hypothetical protein